MSKQFTWWRRFKAYPKFPKKFKYKGVSELLQRIEFGEFEFDKLGRELKLEDYIYQYKEQEMVKAKPWLLNDNRTLRDTMQYDLHQYRKRTHIIHQYHLEAENKKLNLLTQGLSQEFKFSNAYVEQIMHNFGGTSRDLYYYCMQLATGREIDPNEQERYWVIQPMHVLKEPKWKQLWRQCVEDHDWQIYLQPHYN